MFKQPTILQKKSQRYLYFEKTQEQTALQFEKTHEQTTPRFEIVTMCVSHKE